MLRTPTRSMGSEEAADDEHVPAPGPFAAIKDVFKGCGCKVLGTFLAVAVLVMIFMEISILHATTKRYNESLVNQMILKNEALSAYLENVTLDNAQTRHLIQEVLKTNQENQLESLHRADVTDGKLELIQKTLPRLMEENKRMYQQAETGFNENLKLVRDALTMNTNTVIKLLDDNNSVREQLHRSTPAQRQAYTNSGGTSQGLSALGYGACLTSMVVILYKY